MLPFYCERNNLAQTCWFHQEQHQTAGQVNKYFLLSTGYQRTRQDISGITLEGHED